MVISKTFYYEKRLDVVLDEPFTILKEDLEDTNSFYKKLDQALSEVNHWNRDPFDQRTMLEVRNLYETDINLDEDVESEVENNLSLFYHQNDYSRFYYFFQSICEIRNIIAGFSRSSQEMNLPFSDAAPSCEEAL